jgi:hypothetical protein
MHNNGISMHMRTTINIDEKTALVRMGLEYLIARESAKRLARLGGTEKDLHPIPRRKSNW